MTRWTDYTDDEPEQFSSLGALLGWGLVVGVVLFALSQAAQAMGLW